MFSQEEERQRLLLIDIEAPEDATTLQTMAITFTDTLEITLRLLDQFQVNRAQFLTPSYNFNRAKSYFLRYNQDLAVYGSINRLDDDSYSMTVSIWSLADDDVIIEETREFESIFDIFDVVDELSITIAEEITGEHIGFGTVLFNNIGDNVQYSVYIDDLLLGTSIDEADVLFGERTIKITRPTVLGDETVIEEVINIEEGQEYTIRFELETSGNEEDQEVPRSENTERGNIVITSVPEDSEVFLSGQSLGTTPLERLGIPEGIYPLTISRIGYFAEERALTVQPNRWTEMEIELSLNADSELVQPYLIDPGKLALYNVIYNLSRITIITTAAFNQHFSGPIPMGTYHPWNIDSQLLASANLGFFIAGEPIFGLISMGLPLLYDFAVLPITDPYLDRSDVLAVVLYSTIHIAPILADMIFTYQFALGTRNEQIEEYEETGLPEEIPETVPLPERNWGIITDFGGGGLLHTGGYYSFLDRIIQVKLLAGAAFTSPYDYLDIGISVLSSADFLLFNSIYRWATPVLGIGAQMTYDFYSGETGVLPFYQLGLALRMPVDSPRILAETQLEIGSRVYMHFPDHSLDSDTQFAVHIPKIYAGIRF